MLDSWRDEPRTEATCFAIANALYDILPHWIFSRAGVEGAANTRPGLESTYERVAGVLSVSVIFLAVRAMPQLASDMSPIVQEFGGRNRIGCIRRKSGGREQFFPTLEMTLELTPGDT